MKQNEYELGSHQQNTRRRGPGGGHGPMSGGGEKAKDFKGIMKQLLRYASRAKFFMLLAVLFAMGGSILTLMGPDNLSMLTDEITEGIGSSMMVSQLEEMGVDVAALVDSNMTMEQLATMMQTTTDKLEEMGVSLDALANPGIDMDAVWSIGIFLIGVYALSYLLSILQGVIMATVMQNTAKRLRSDIGQKINRLPMKYFSSHSKGDVLSRVTNDVDTIGQSLTQAVGTVISSVTLLVGSVVMMTLTNGILTVTAIGSTFFGFVFMMVVMRTSQKHFKRQQQNLGQMNGHIEEMYAGHSLVKAYNGEQEATGIFHSINENLRNSAFMAQAMSGLMMPMMTFIGNLGYVCVCIVGALLALNDVITFGVIVAFMIYIRLFTQPLGQIAQGMQNLQSGAAAAERVFGFLEEPEMPEEHDKRATLGNVKGDIEFKNVHFGYDDDKIIINDFSAHAKAGQKIAIVGPTGAGKTTMVNLLMRFYDIQSGDILIDGVSINDVQREAVHAQFCMVLQDTWLFEGTLRENLIYCSENVSEETLTKACKAVGLYHFIKTLPHGYDTVLNDALNLSAGQKQQITIARAMIADKPIIILDEATSSIDTRTELQIQTAMDQLMADRTSFVIAHRLSTIKNADLILVMKDGDVIETGTHAELLAQKGFYADLYNAQFEQVG